MTKVFSSSSAILIYQFLMNVCYKEKVHLSSYHLMLFFKIKLLEEHRKGSANYFECKSRCNQTMHSNETFLLKKNFTSYAFSHRRFFGTFLFSSKCIYQRSSDQQQNITVYSGKYISVTYF